MKKRIIICADGTWNKPEEDLKKDFPTNILKLARAIKPTAKEAGTQKLIPQQVFYDLGVGSDGNSISGGITGNGLQKNIMDDYRYIVQNYSPGDELFLFGFSRGAYTIRSLCGLINNCGIVKRNNAALIQKAFNHYKKSGSAYSPNGEKSLEFRKNYSHASRNVHFVGVWDTVGAMGIPISFLGFFDDKDEFYDTKIGANIKTARHALAIDEHRSDFEPTIWLPQKNMDLQQVWFSGAHSNIGGSYKPDKDGTVLSDNSLAWMIKEASKAGLSIENHLTKQLKLNPLSTLHNSRRSFYRIKKKYFRPLEQENSDVLIHTSVNQRWKQDKSYRPKNLVDYINQNGWPKDLIK